MTLRRKVRVVINGFHAKSGGGITYLRNILPALAEDDRLDLHLILDKSQNESFYPIDERVRVHLFDFSLQFFGLAMWEQLVLPVVTRRMGADVVFSPANFGPVLARNHVILLRNSLAVLGQERRITKQAYWVVLGFVSVLSLLLATKAIAVSNYARQLFTIGPLGFFNRKMGVVYHGTSVQFQSPPTGSDAPPFLLAVSDIYVQKNFHTLIRALARVNELYGDIGLRIAGHELDAGYARRLRALAERLGLAGKVEFLGRVETGELNRLLHSCAVFVFPSTVETFGNPLLEAMAAGAPIASSNTAAMPEVLGNGGLTFDPKNVDQMAEQIVKLLENESLRRELGGKAGERARDFTWKRAASQTAAILIEAAGDLSDQPRLSR